MSRREAVLSALLIFGVALVVRAFFAAQIVFPKPEDTAYYVGVAQQPAGRPRSGHGRPCGATDTPPLIFPRPAFEVWMPLPTWLAAIPMALFGASFAAAQVSSVLIGAIVPVLAWRLAADVAVERGLSVGTSAMTLALGAGLTCAVYLPLLLHSALPDSTMPFAALGLVACLLMARIARDPARRGAARSSARSRLGSALGLAALTRNEAVWLALIWVVRGLDDAARPGERAPPHDRRRRRRCARPSSRRGRCRNWIEFWAVHCPGRPLPTRSP